MRRRRRKRRSRGGRKERWRKKGESTYPARFEALELVALDLEHPNLCPNIIISQHNQNTQPKYTSTY